MGKWNLMVEFFKNGTAIYEPSGDVFRGNDLLSAAKKAAKTGYILIFLQQVGTNDFIHIFEASRRNLKKNEIGAKYLMVVNKLTMIHMPIYIEEAPESPKAPVGLCPRDCVGPLEIKHQMNNGWSKLYHISKKALFDNFLLIQMLTKICLNFSKLNLSPLPDFIIWLKEESYFKITWINFEMTILVDCKEMKIMKSPGPLIIIFDNMHNGIQHVVQNSKFYFRLVKFGKKC